MSNSVPITLQFSARNLRDADTFSKSDPICVVYEISSKEPNLFGFKPARGNFNAREVFRTARIKNNLNPDWEQAMSLKYKFEQEQWLFIKVLDVDSKHNANVADQDFLGGIMTSVGRIISGQIDGKYTVQLVDASNNPVVIGKAASTLSVVSRQLPRTLVEYKISADFTLGSTRLLAKDTPYLQVADSAGQVIHETPKGHGKTSVYASFTVGDQHLAGSSSWRLKHNHEGDDIGSAEIKEGFFRELRDGVSVSVYDGKGKVRGQLTFRRVERIEHAEEIVGSIVQHIADGNKIACIVAYDFTGSNGDPRDKHSLHYIGDEKNPVQNQYMRATLGVIPILDQYDSNGKYPVYGYGMTFDAGKSVQHDRLIAEDAQYADGVAQLYQSFIHKNGFALSGPTCFAPIINATIRRVKDSKERKDPDTYTVLVIFTDGAINDMDATISAIVNASSMSISIIIIGIGEGDFSSMDRLDNDGKPPLVHRGIKAARDIVQFVPFSKCPDASALQSATLAELPGQIMEYYTHIKK